MKLGKSNVNLNANRNNNFQCSDINKAFLCCTANQVLNSPNIRNINCTKCKLFAQIVANGMQGDKCALSQFDHQTIKPFIPPRRRRGCPRTNWVEDTKWHFWERIKEHVTPGGLADSLHQMSEDQLEGANEYIKEAARKDFKIFW